MTKSEWVTGLALWLSRYCSIDDSDYLEEQIHEYIKSRQVYDNEASIESFGLRYRKQHME